MPAKIEDNPVEIPLKGYTLEVTRKFFRIYKDKKASLRIPSHDVRAVAPVEPNSIRIYYYGDNLPYKSYACNIAEHQLGKYAPSPVELCRKLSREFIKKRETIKTKTKRGRGRGRPRSDTEIVKQEVFKLKRCWLYLLPDECIVQVCKNVRIDNEKGLLCITNNALVYETDDGISMDLSLALVLYIKNLEKNIIRVYWDRNLSEINEPIRYFDIIISKRDNRDAISLLMKEQFTSTESEHSFAELDKYYSGMRRDKLINLYMNKDKDLDDYLERYSKVIFGDLKRNSFDYNKELIMACKSQRLEISLISEMTDEELVQRIYAKRFFELGDYYTENIKSYRYFIKNIDQNRWAKELLKKIPEIKKNSPEIISPVPFFNKTNSEFLRFYDKRVEILYKEWCKKESLEDFTDEYDDKWIKYILKRLDVLQKHSLLDATKDNIKTLKSDVRKRNRNRKTLANFSAPKNIPEKDIYNNCWYDKRRKIWFVQNDHLPKVIQNAVHLDQAACKRLIGREVWGIKQNKVKMFCGFPSIKYKNKRFDRYRYGMLNIIHEQDNLDLHHAVFTSRKTGQMSRQPITPNFHYILPILQESDLTVDLINKHGEMTYDTDVIQYTISTTGDWIKDTPKAARFMGQKFGFADIPLNERVRRAVFSAQTGLQFSPEGTFDPDTVKIPNRYPNTIYDKRFEEGDGNDEMTKHEIKAYCFDVYLD